MAIPGYGNRRGTRYLDIGDDATIADAFALRCRASPSAIAYREWDGATGTWRDFTWREAGDLVRRAREALRRDGFAAGERLAIMMKNGVNWVLADQAAYAHGLATVPLFVDDRPDNVAYILNDAGVTCLFIDGTEQWKRLKTVRERLTGLRRIVAAKPIADTGEPRLVALADWLSGPLADASAAGSANPAEWPLANGGSLATIVYTSGTTGKPKGVMLSHRNMLANAQSGLAVYDVLPDDVFLSFLPLSHMFERTCDYYLNILSGAAIAFSRSVPQLAEDFRMIRPTILFSVPRIYERFYAAIQDQLKKAPPFKKKLFALAVDCGWARFRHAQGRAGWRPILLLWPLLKRLVARPLLARFGGRLRFSISGGAALSPDVARVFIGLGLPVCQGYGLTEASPLLTVNLLDRNDPATIGPAVPGVELRTGENGVLLARGPNIMLGYWRQPEATAAVLSADGWLNTGDQARIDADGVVTITGRLKEIIVLGNGEKVPPVDMELSIQLDPLFEQVLVYGEAKPYLTAIVVVNDESWRRAAAEAGIASTLAGSRTEQAEKFLLKRIAARIKDFPGYAQVRKLTVSPEKWTIDNGMMTPTLKLKRNTILQKHADDIQAMYKGHVL